MKETKISKKKLLSLVNENLQEMSMEFQTPDRPDRGIQRALSVGDTAHQNVPYPETGNPNTNFQELLASERYRQVIAKLREYIPNAPTLNGQQGLGPLTQMMMAAHNNIVRIERAHRGELEALAIELVMKEMQIPEGAVQWDAKIVGMGEVDTEDFNREGQEQEPQGEDPEGGDEEAPEGMGEEEEQIEEDLYGNLQNLDLEKAKRRLIDSIIQGASKRGHYMYHYVSERITQITGSDTLISDYGILMSINDTSYWQFADEMMKMAMGQPGGGGMVGGKESVNVTTDPPTITARAVNFPILVHELIKGMMELFGTRGRNKEMYKQVESTEDTMENEIWDLRLGPSIWDRLREQFPEEILTDETKVELQNYLLAEIFELPVKQFLVFFREVFLKTERGKTLMNILMSRAEELFYPEKEPEYNDEYGDEEPEVDLGDEIAEAAQEVSDEDLLNFLTSLGIKMDKPGGAFGEKGNEFDPNQLN